MDQISTEVNGCPRVEKDCLTLHANEIEPGKCYCGLSLYGCVYDVLNGKIREEQIAKIFAETCARTEYEFQEIINRYKRFYWSNDQAGEEIAWRFWRNNLIEQPRLTGNNNGPDSSLGRWIAEENIDQIKYLAL